jgi:hypothetical protein
MSGDKNAKLAMEGLMLLGFETILNGRVALGLVLAAVTSISGASAQEKQTIWKFDNLESIGGFKTSVEGHPKIVATADGGKAMEFNGVDDAIWIENHPLAGVTTFTMEAIFRPDGGDKEQRWFHIASIDPKTGQAALPSGTADPNPRFTFELRVSDHDQWFLDAFTHGCATVPDTCSAKEGYNRALMNPKMKYPIGHWYAVAQTYDGKMYRSYVDGVLQMEAPVEFKPQGPGRTAVGTRMNKVNYFRGLVMEARFTPAALPPDKLLNVPAALNEPDPSSASKPASAPPSER